MKAFRVSGRMYSFVMYSGTVTSTGALGFSSVISLSLASLEELEEEELL